MKQKQLKRILDLVRETGDRLIIADDASDEIFVIMNLEEYENLVGAGNFDVHNLNFDARDSDDLDFGIEPEESAVSSLSEQEMLEKINRDVAEWRAAQKKKDEEMLADDLTVTTNSDEVVEEKGKEQNEHNEPKKTEKLGPMTPLAAVLNDEKYLKREFDDTPRVNVLLEEDLSDVPAEAEQKFYLEPVE